MFPMKDFWVLYLSTNKFLATCFISAGLQAMGNFMDVETSSYLSAFFARTNILFHVIDCQF